MSLQATTSPTAPRNLVAGITKSSIPPDARRAHQLARRVAAETLYELAYSRQMLGELSEAGLCYESVLLIEPGHAKATRALKAMERVQSVAA